MEDLSYLGKGVKFPFQVNKGTGRFEMSEGYDNIKESVYIILMTQKGERWLRPDFGTNSMSYVFSDTSIMRLSMMKRDLQEAIYDNEPRISNVEVDIDSTSKDGCLIISVGYVVAATHQRDSIVFPFYLNASAEEKTDDEESIE